MSGHTPGPWIVVGPSHDGECLRVFSGSEYVAIVGGSDHSALTIANNANLIAAAPYMKKMIETIYGAIHKLQGPMAGSSDAELAKWINDEMNNLLGEDWKE